MSDTHENPEEIDSQDSSSSQAANLSNDSIE